MMPIDNHFENIDDCIQYEYDGNQPYTSIQIINNVYNTVLETVLYMEPSKIWRKNPASEKYGPNSIFFLGSSTMNYVNSNV